MTTELSHETSDYIADQFRFGRWQETPTYLGGYAVFPGSGRKPPFAVHKSLTQPGMIAFYDSVEKAEARRETIMKVGKFLTKYRSEIYTQDEIRALAERYQAEIKADSCELAFAETADEIEKVYVNGPHSCMAKDAREYESDIHPVRVYAAGDLAIAHIGTHSRALCWPKNKVYGRVYGNTEADRLALESALKAQDYEYAPSKLHGAKLLRIEQGDSFVMPYLDNDFHANDKGDHMIMDRFNGILADSQTGLLDESKDCSHCGDSFTPDDAECDDLCNYCYENTSCCASCDDRVSYDDIRWVESGDESLCNYCFSERYTNCDDCGEPTLREKITEIGDKGFCQNCLCENASPCEACGEWMLSHDITAARCGENYCTDVCLGEHEPDCEECQETQNNISIGDTSENLELPLDAPMLSVTKAWYLIKELEIA